MIPIACKFTILVYIQILLIVLGGQTCTDSFSILQQGRYRYDGEGVAIVPRLNFTCNGRITNIMARTFRHNEGNDTYPYLQIWRPSMSSMSMIYSKVGEVLVEESQLTQVNGSERLNNSIANITLTDDSRILVQSGDVVGFYHQSDSNTQVRTSTFVVEGYVLYYFNGSNAETLDLNNATTYYGRQPLMQFTVGRLYYFDLYFIKSSLHNLRYSV